MLYICDFAVKNYTRFSRMQPQQPLECSLYCASLKAPSSRPVLLCHRNADSVQTRPTCLYAGRPLAHISNIACARPSMQNQPMSALVSCYPTTISFESITIHLLKLERRIRNDRNEPPEDRFFDEPHTFDFCNFDL